MTTDERDYAAEMSALFDQAAGAGDCVLAVLAAELAGKLRAGDPELLAGWLDLHAQAAIADALGTRLRSYRARTRGQAAAGAFAKAAAAQEAGDDQALSAYDVRHVVDDADTWRRVADMTGPDHIYVANTYQQQARTAAMLAAFHHAVAKKIGKRATSAVMTEPQYERLYRSIVGQAADAA
jgi:hypothetical protein